jgi:predicted enzyme related to lactoylglutathione lyase
MKRFYSRILGWDISDQGKGYCYIDAGGLLLGLQETRAGDWDLPTGQSTYLDVEVEDPITLRSLLAERGVKILREEVTPEAIFINVADPEGNLIGFFKSTEPSPGG